MSVVSFFYNFKNKEGLFSKISRLDPTKLWRIRFDEYDTRTLEQNAKIHAMLTDIANQAMHLNQKLDADSWKRLCVAQFRSDCIDNDVSRLADYWRKIDFKLMPSLDGRSLVQLGAQTREMPKYVMAGLVEWLYVYGAENNIAWSEPEEQWDGRVVA